MPETVSPGSTLVTLRCTKPAGTEGCLRYALEGPPASRSRFRMEGPQLQVRGGMGSAQDLGEPSGDLLTCAVMPGPRLGLPGPSAPYPSLSPPSVFPGITALQGTLALPDPPLPILARQVNTTLDYDSEAVAAVGFQFTATIVVTVGGQSPQSSECSCLQGVPGGVGKGPS